MGVDFWDCPNCGESTNDCVDNPWFEIIELDETFGTCEACCEDFKSRLTPEYDTDGELIGYHVTREYIEELIDAQQSKIKRAQATIDEYKKALVLADAWEKEEAENHKSAKEDKKVHGPKRKAPEKSSSDDDEEPLDPLDEVTGEPPSKKQRVQTV